MVDFDQFANLGGGFSAVKAHHEKLSHSSISALGTLRNTVHDFDAALYLSMSSHTDGDAILKGGVKLFMFMARRASSSDTPKFHR